MCGVLSGRFTGELRIFENVLKYVHNVLRQWLKKYVQFWPLVQIIIEILRHSHVIITRLDKPSILLVVYVLCSISPFRFMITYDFCWDVCMSNGNWRTIYWGTAHGAPCVTRLGIKLVYKLFFYRKRLEITSIVTVKMRTIVYPHSAKSMNKIMTKRKYVIIFFSVETRNLIDMENVFGSWICLRINQTIWIGC